MSLDYVRKLVSGNKARFVDSETAVDSDLVYVTDRIIIMGYPAVGISALYRNKRRDVLKFINSRHGEKWWIWNLCPSYENAYSPESMHNRVSRYPFPDHHPPPLPSSPLAVREMTAWSDGDAERIAIIHCKAGKGRSGTSLCSYLLSLPKLPPPPQSDRSYTKEERGSHSTDQGWVVVGAGDEYESVLVPPDREDAHTPAHSEKISVYPRSTNSSTTTVSHPSLPSIDIPVETSPPFDPIDVGDEGRPEEQGQRDRLDGKVDEVFRLHSSRRMKPTSSRRGVSIPSQRRWCRYVNLLFSNQAPSAYLQPGRSRILLKSVTSVMHPPSGWQKPIASSLLGSGGSGNGKAWASVARYDDEYVAELRRRGGAGEGVTSEISWGGVGGEGAFDSTKMFRSCGKMVTQDRGDTTEYSEYSEYNVHRLTPRLPDGTTSLILDRDREFRLKLHSASLPSGWLWVIPAFHLPESTDKIPRTHRLTFTRSQIDFPLGPGQALHRVIVEIEELDEADRRDAARSMTSEEEERTGYEDTRGEKVKEEGE